MRNPTLTAEQLREMFHYDPLTGIFTRAKAVGRHGRWREGDIAGTSCSSGRRLINIDGKMHKVHRLAFLYMTGKWPTAEIDHINLDDNDNRWRNLREATSSQNKANRRMKADNRSGIKGVRWKADHRKWEARIKNRHLGYRDCPAAAHFLYVIAAQQEFGEFFRGS
jgi:hypothetical protein